MDAALPGENEGDDPCQARQLLHDRTIAAAASYAYASRAEFGQERVAEIHVEQSVSLEQSAHSDRLQRILSDTRLRPWPFRA